MHKIKNYFKKGIVMLALAGTLLTASIYGGNATRGCPAETSGEQIISECWEH